MLENLPIAMFCKDAKNNFQYTMWNKKAEELWGLTAAEVIGRTDFDIFPFEKAQFLRARDLHILEFQKPIQFQEEYFDVHNVRKEISQWQGPAGDTSDAAFMIMGWASEKSEVTSSRLPRPYLKDRSR